MYFAFLSFYTSALVIPAVVGIILWFSSDSLLRPYTSIFIILWALLFLENWKNRQSELGSRWSNNISEHTPPDLMTHAEHSPWWKTELKTILSIPLVVASVLVTGFNMTVAFVLEAFVVRMYHGPFQFLAVRNEEEKKTSSSLTKISSFPSLSPNSLLSQQYIT